MKSKDFKWMLLELWQEYQENFYGRSVELTFEGLMEYIEAELTGKA
jgi:hypothetical protein